MTTPNSLTPDTTPLTKDTPPRCLQHEEQGKHEIGLPISVVEGAVGIGHTDLEFATGLRTAAVASVS